MSDWPSKGDVMTFLGKNGYSHELDQAMAIFSIGHRYTVEDCRVGDWSHSIKFEGIAGRYNGVMFEREEAMTEAKHSPLEPCPFCGKPPFVDDDRDGVCSISCPTDECIGVEVTCPTADDARELWNTRAPTSLHAELVAALFNLVEAVESAVDLDNHVRSFGTRVAAAHNVLQKVRQK